MTLKIYVGSKENKIITIDSESIKVTGDIYEFIKKTINNKGLKLTDFDDFIAEPSESFTGYREAVTIVNTLKYLVNKIPIKNLEFPKYHKEPNITKPKS